MSKEWQSSASQAMQIIAERIQPDGMLRNICIANNINYDSARSIEDLVQCISRNPRARGDMHALILSWFHRDVSVTEHLS